MTKIVELIISEEEMENQDGVFAISLVEEPAIEENWIALKKQKQKVIQCAKIDEDKRLLIAPALIPNKQIFRLDEEGKDYYVYFSKDTIQKASQLFLAIDKSVNYGFEHLPKGTWFVTMKVNNDDIWAKVKEGEIKGFSIEGYFTDKLKRFSKKSDADEKLVNKIKEILRSEC